MSRYEFCVIETLKSPIAVNDLLAEQYVTASPILKKSVLLLWCSIKTHFIKAAALKDSEKEAESSGLSTFRQ